MIHDDSENLKRVEKQTTHTPGLTISLFLDLDTIKKLTELDQEGVGYRECIRKILKEYVESKL